MDPMIAQMGATKQQSHVEPIASIGLLEYCIRGLRATMGNALTPIGDAMETMIALMEVTRFLRLVPKTALRDLSDATLDSAFT